MQRLRVIILLAAAFFVPSSGYAEDYCTALDAAGLEGKFVTIHLDDGHPEHTTHGNFVRVTSGILVVRLGEVFSFINCEHVLSVVVNASIYGTPESEAGSP